MDRNEGQKRERVDRLHASLLADPGRLRELLERVGEKQDLAELQDQLWPCRRWTSLPAALSRKAFAFLDVRDDCWTTLPLVCRRFQSLLSDLQRALPWSEIVVESGEGPKDRWLRRFASLVPGGVTPILHLKNVPDLDKEEWTGAREVFRRVQTLDTNRVDLIVDPRLLFRVQSYFPAIVRLTGDVNLDWVPECWWPFVEFLSLGSNDVARWRRLEAKFTSLHTLFVAEDGDVTAVAVPTTVRSLNVNWPIAPNVRSPTLHFRDPSSIVNLTLCLEVEKDEGRCSPSTCEKLAAQMAPLLSLQTVRYQGITPLSRILAGSRLSHLTSLSIESNHVRSLDDMRHFPHLQSLSWHIDQMESLPTELPPGPCMKRFDLRIKSFRKWSEERSVASPFLFGACLRMKRLEKLSLELPSRSQGWRDTWRQAQCAFESRLNLTLEFTTEPEVVEDSGPDDDEDRHHSDGDSPEDGPEGLWF